MTLDIVTSCNGHIAKIQPLLDSLVVQTVQPDRILILIYTAITKDEQEMFLYTLQRFYPEDFFAKIIVFSHLNSDHQPGKWHGYDRRFITAQAKSTLCFLIDCDNKFQEDMVEQLLWWQTQLTKELHRTVIVSPTIMWRKSGKIQSQWITWFRYRFPKYQFTQMDAQNRQEVKMIGGNSLFGPTSLFQAIGFDERFAYSYEDIDFSYRCFLRGYPIIVLNKVETYHMERTKNYLDKTLLMSSPKAARYRARNRVLFVKKNATQREKIQYLYCWLRIQTVWFFVQIALHAWSPFWKIRKLYRKAVRDGTLKGVDTPILSSR